MDMRNLINVVAEAQKLDELRGLRAQRGHGFTSKAEVLDYLESEGLELLGKGSYGAVFDHPSFGGRYVLKIFADPFYEQFLNHCIDMGGNPHLPKVFGRVMKLTQEGRMVRIERLGEVDEGTFRRLRINKLALAAMNADDLSEKTRANVLGFAERQGLGEFFQVMLDVVRMTPPRAVVDLDAQNFMTRGATLVIADPYAGGKIPFLR